MKWWAYTNSNDLGDSNTLLTETPPIISSKPTAGKAVFKVIKSLPWPPKLEISLSLSESRLLQVSVTNTDSEPLSVQSRDTQRFITPWGPLQPEETSINARGPRIIDPESGKGNWEVRKSSTGEVVKGFKKRSTGCIGLTSGNVNTRPMIDNVLVLEPGVALVREIVIGTLVEGLDDGQYSMRLEPRDCRWWHGRVNEKDAEDGRVPARLGGTTIPPLILESQGRVEVHVKNGKSTFQRVVRPTG